RGVPTTPPHNDARACPLSWSMADTLRLSGHRDKARFASIRPATGLARGMGNGDQENRWREVRAARSESRGQAAGPAEYRQRIPAAVQEGSAGGAGQGRASGSE